MEIIIILVLDHTVIIHLLVEEFGYYGLKEAIIRFRAVGRRDDLFVHVKLKSLDLLLEPALAEKV